MPDNGTRKNVVSLQDIICNNPLMRDKLDESIHQIIDETDDNTLS